MIPIHYNHKVRLLLSLLLLLGSLLTLNVYLKKPPPAQSQPRPAAKTLPFDEIQTIRATADLAAQTRAYRHLIERVGPLASQEALRDSGLAFDGQTHLLNHTVGDYLYEKYGNVGLTYCREYFLASCYHGFLIQAVARDGLERLVEIMAECWLKGGPVATQCAHAIGHGFLAWIGYKEFPKALKECDRLSQISKNFPLFNCHDGAFMENVWAVHESGRPSKDRWLRDDDPLYPCDERRIPEPYKNACWSNQPMRLYQLFQGDLKKVAQVCLNLKNKTYQKTCFDGLARQIHPLTRGDADQTFRLCNLMPSNWQEPCVISIVKAFFSVGDHQTPYRLCPRLNPQARDACHQELAKIMADDATKPAE